MQSKEFVGPARAMASSSYSSVPGLKGVGIRDDSFGKRNDLPLSNGTNYGLGFTIIGLLLCLRIVIETN